MQFKALISLVLNHPATKAAALKVAAEITEHGLVNTVEYALDRSAYMIAKHIVKQERKMENK